MAAPPSRRGAVRRRGAAVAGRGAGCGGRRATASATAAAAAVPSHAFRQSSWARAEGGSARTPTARAAAGSRGGGAGGGCSRCSRPLPHRPAHAYSRWLFWIETRTKIRCPITARPWKLPLPGEGKINCGPHKSVACRSARFPSSWEVNHPCSQQRSAIRGRVSASGDASRHGDQDSDPRLHPDRQADSLLCVVSSRLISS